MSASLFTYFLEPMDINNVQYLFQIGQRWISVRGSCPPPLRFQIPCSWNAYSGALRPTFSGLRLLSYNMLLHPLASRTPSCAKRCHGPWSHILRLAQHHLNHHLHHICKKTFVKMVLRTLLHMMWEGGWECTILLRSGWELDTHPHHSSPPPGP